MNPSYEDHLAKKGVIDDNPDIDLEIPQADSLLMGFMPKFREISLDDSEHSWSRFIQLLEELTEFVRKFVKISDSSSTTKQSKQINPDNHEDNPKLYKRNRSQAIPTILGVTSRVRCRNLGYHLDVCAGCDWRC